MECASLILSKPSLVLLLLSSSRQSQLLGFAFCNPSCKEFLDNFPFKGEAVVTSASYNASPKMRLQIMNNIGLILSVLQRQRVTLVNIGPEGMLTTLRYNPHEINKVGLCCIDICDGNTKLVLGLIWTLILRYQIQKDATGMIVLSILFYVLFFSLSLTIRA